MDGSLYKYDTASKKCRNTEKKNHKQKKYPKKQNKMLFKLAKKSSSRHELKKINNINTTRYDYSSINNSRVSSDSESI